VEAELEKAKQYCMRLLALRARSEHELLLRLQERGVGKNVIDECLASLRRAGLVNDAEFAASWVDSRMRLRPMGRRALERELREKGVGGDLARAAVEAALNEEDELTSARALARRHLGADRSRQAIRRAQQALLRRGFDSAIVWQILDEMTARGAG
jgi:regulatory protein